VTPAPSLTIMSHPGRGQAARALANRLGPLPSRLSFEIDARDTTVLGSAATAWRPYGPATHHAVLQDDVLPGPDFPGVLRRLTARHPGAVLSLFCEWGCKTAAAARIAALAGYDAVEVVDKYVPVNAVLAPRPVAAEVAAELAARAGAATPDDVVVREVVDRLGVPALLPLPNSVQDAGLASSAGNGPMGPRRAACPPGVLPGSRGPLTGLTFVPFFRWQTGDALALLRPAGAGPWTRTGLAGAVAEHGLTPDLVEGLRAATRAPAWLSARPDLAAAFVLTVAAAVLCAAALAPPDPAGPAADATLRTAGPGALRCLLPCSAAEPAATEVGRLGVEVALRTADLLRAGSLAPVSCREDNA
jgi:hypothetical protein